MASRKQQKEQAKAERLSREAEAQTSQRRQNRVRLIASAFAIAVLAVIVLVAVNQSGDKGGSASEVSGGGEVEESLRGVPQKGFTLGDPKASVAINEFADLQCPACKVFADSELDSVIDALVRPGKARLVFKNYVILGPDSETAAKAALAASAQNRGWQFVELFYRNQGVEQSGYVTDDFLEAVAKAAGVPDLAKWNSDRDRAAWSANLDRVQSETLRLGFDSTPSFNVVGPGGQSEVPSDNSASSIEEAVKQVQ